MHPPVIWFSLVEGERAEAKWDSIWLRQLFKYGTHIQLWTERIEETDGGAVVVLPGGVHARPDYMERIRHLLRQLKWAVLIVTADEQGRFPGYDLQEEFPHVRVWAQTPKPGRYGYRVFGYCSTWTDGAGDPLHKDLDWSFAGQVNNPERKQLVATLQEALETNPELTRGVVLPTEGFNQGLDHDDYRRLLARSKVVPCPPGATTVDTFRVWEAIEHGAIPVVPDSVYWAQVAPGSSLPMVDHWDTNLAELLGWWADKWPKRSNQLWAWWFNRRAWIADRLRQDVLELGGSWDIGDLAVVITSSPTPANPSIDTVSQVIQSVRDRTDAPIWLLMDGVSPRLRDNVSARNDYELYIQRVLWAAEHQWSGVVPVVSPRWEHQTGMISSLLRSGLIHQPHLLVMEHDTLLEGDVPLDQLQRLLDLGELDVIRLNYGTAVDPAHEHMYIDAEPILRQGLPIRRTWQWSQQLHLARTAYYADLLARAPSESYVEEVASGVMSSGWSQHGIHSWFSHRVAMYTPEGDQHRSRHIDDRNGDERYLGRP